MYQGYVMEKIGYSLYNLAGKFFYAAYWVDNKGYNFLNI